MGSRWLSKLGGKENSEMNWERKIKMKGEEM
jgi:hypothetical protein